MTRTGITADMVTTLGAPTPREEIKQRQGPGGRMLDYVDARFVMDRLDGIGPENWQDRFEDAADGSVRCGIGILVDGEWIWKWDVGVKSDIEPELGAVSHAFKRAGVKWGIARDLYGHTTHAAPGASSRPAAPAPRPSPSPAGGGAPEEPEWVAAQLGTPDALQTAPAPTGATESHGDGGTCPVHHLAWVLRPGGVSKASGKPYDPFWACPSDERPFCKQKPDKAWAARQEVA